MAPPIPGWLYGLMYRGVQAGLCQVIPLPFVDDWAEGKVRKWMVREILPAPSSADVVRILSGADEGRGLLAGAARAVVLKPLKWIFRKTFFVLSIKKAVDIAADVFHQGYLLRHARERGLLDTGDPVEAARRVRAATLAVSDELDPGPVKQILKRAFTQSPGVVRDAAVALAGKLRRQQADAAPEAPTRVEDEPGGMRKLLDGIVDAVWYQEDYLKMLGQRFDDRFAAERGAATTKPAIVLAMALLAPLAAHAQTIDPETLRTATMLRDRALAGSGAREIARSLTSEVGPRSAGSRGDRAAVAWALAKMKELGIPRVVAEPVTVPRWDRGSVTGEILSPWPQRTVLCALGGSVGTPEEGIEAEVVHAESLEKLEAMDPERIRGRIVFLSERMARTPDGAGYGFTVRQRSRGPSAAARKGAVALLIRSVGTSQDRIAHTGALRYDRSLPLKIPAAALSNPDADVLLDELSSGKPVRFRLHMSCRTLPDAASANVIGEIPGRELSGKIVLVGAHLDSWDLGTGAIDDAAGCAIALETARRIAALPRAPRRTVRVVLFADEESSGEGSEVYAMRPDVLDHAAAIEADFGSGRPWRLDTMVAEGSLPLVDSLMTLLQPLGIQRGEDGSAGAPDLGAMAPCAVPVLDLIQDGTFYFDVHHTANDTMAKVDAADLDANVAAYVATVYALAEMEAELGRPPLE